jgi:ATP-binding cassette subfamily B protein
MDTITKINLNEIICKELYNNKIMVATSVTTLFGALILERIVFPKMYSDFVANFPTKIANIDYKEIMVILSPYLFSEVLFYVANSSDAYIFPTLEKSIISQIFNKIMKSSKTLKTEINANELILNVKKIFDIRDIYYLISTHILPAVAVTFGIIYFFLMADRNYGLLVTVILVISFIALLWMSTKCFIFAKINEKETNNFCDDIHDIFNNIDHVISSNMQDNEEKRSQDKQINLNEGIVKRDICNTNLKFMFSIVYFILTIILNGMAMNLYYLEKIDKTTTIAIFFMVLSLISLYGDMIYELNKIIKAIGDYDEVVSYFAKYHINTKPLQPLLNTKNNQINFVNVSLNYETKKLFNNFNLTIKGGSKVGIYGEIGSGKSSLLKLLAGLVEYQGKIMVDGLDVSKYDKSALIKILAYIPQNPKLFNRTVYENLNYGSNYSEEQIKEIINRFELIELIDKLKNGLSTTVGKNGEKLSGGQRQLIYILRCFIQNKKIILFDEPTSALDVEHKQLLIKMLKKMKNKTMIIVTHDNDIKELFDRVLVFESGYVTEDTDNQ